MPRLHLEGPEVLKEGEQTGQGQGGEQDVPRNDTVVGGLGGDDDVLVRPVEFKFEFVELVFRVCFGFVLGFKSSRQM
jgi:hypothetical protein